MRSEALLLLTATVLATFGAVPACGSSADSGVTELQDGSPPSGDADLDGGDGPRGHDEGGLDAADAADSSSPASSAATLALGYRHACAIRANGTVKCWGSASTLIGVLGLGDQLDRGGLAGQMGAALPAVALGSGRSAKSIAAGLTHTCVILDDARVKCWGFNSDGELGIGSPTSRGASAGDMGDALPEIDLGTGRGAVAIALDEDHSCAILDNGTVKCWGANLHGELGLGDLASRGAAAGQMGNSLPAIDLGTGRTATALALGTYRTCAILDDGSVKCWGYNGAGYLGIGDTSDRGDQPGEMGDALPRVNLGTGRTAKSIAAGSETTCAVLDNGSVKCWGFVLGVFPVQAWGKSPTEMGDALPAVDLGAGRKAKSIAVGTGHYCAILDDDSVKCWGDNSGGALGLGDTKARGSQAAEMGAALPALDLGAGRTARSIALGTSFSCALLDSAELKCWGTNDVGQLGLGDKANRGDGPGEMGTALPALDLGP